MARLHVLIGISDQGELWFWDGNVWVNWETDKRRNLILWKDNQAVREQVFAKRLLPACIAPESVLWPRCQRPGEEG